MTLPPRRARAAAIATVLVVALVCPAVSSAVPPPWGSIARHDSLSSKGQNARAARAPDRSADASSDWTRVMAAELPENAPVERTAEGGWIGAQDLARLLGATKYWHSELRKLELRTPTHRIQLTVDNPFVLFDDLTLELPATVRSSGGRLSVSVALIDMLPRDTTLTRLIYDSHRGLVLRVPPEGLVRTPRIEREPGGLRITFPSDRPEEIAVAGRGRAHFRVRLSGLFVGVLPESLPPTGLLRGARVIPASAGSAFEFAIAPEVQGYRIESSRRLDAVDIVLALDAGSGFERFAPEGPPGPRRVKVIVLDPGHGGADAGVAVGGILEKDLTLSLARELARELELRMDVRVVLTRTDDHGPTVQER
ncbi:MAG TPA: N-acetylmuramoyl-L-alanine amidase, partial [Dongiaceae bacterium]|nr:N-acetylmuramoyl-L-alanine amidase [Dongiaceae bacterium]